MSDPSKLQNTSPIVPSSEEARMRQALGLSEGAVAPRTPQRREPDARGRRFVKDGEVPVVVLSGSRDAAAAGPAPVNRVQAAEGALRTERLAREHAEQALREAQANAQRLQTQLAHAEMAHREALAAEQQVREAAEHALAEATAAREALEARIAELTAPRTRTPRTRTEQSETGGEAPARKPRRTAANPATKREPQPVKWWLPSFKAKYGKG